MGGSQMRKKLLVPLICLFMVLSLIASGCSNSGNNGSDGTKKELTVWIYGWEQKSAKLLAKDAKQWGQTHPGVSIKIVPQTANDMSTKLPATVAGGKNPDITFIDAGTVSTKLAANNKLLALDDLGVNELKAKFYPSVWDSFTWKDKTYGLRITANNLGLFYNKELFDKAGVPYPTDHWTWDDLKNAAKKLINESKGVYGLDLPYYNPQGGWSTWIWLPFLWQNGGSFLNDNRTKAVFNSSEGVETVKYWDQLIKEKVTPRAAAGPNVDRFLTQKTAMVINGPWMIGPWYQDPTMKGKIGVAMLPGQKQQATNIGGEGLVIFKNTKHPQEAYDYVKHLTTDPEFLKQFYQAWITVPPLKEFAGFYDQDPFYAEPMKVFNEQMKYGKSRQFVPAWGEITDVVDRKLSEVFTNGKDPQQALNDAAQQVDSLLVETK
jgi:multiple sugar transport system substrate-binding protein